MSCNDVASVLDHHRIALLKPAERAAIGAHLASCEDCSAAWQATGELLALRIPATPATLLERALLASRAPQNAQSRRARSAVVAGAVLLAGAAAAAVAIVSMTREQSAPAASSAPMEQSDTPATPTAVGERGVEAEGATATPQRDGVTSIDLVNTSLQLVPFLRVAPVYPPEPLAEKLAGRVVIELDVTATGEVEDARVVESTDARFDASALTAVRQWKYLPRIVAGKRAAAEDIRVNVNYQPSPNVPTQAAFERAITPIGPGLPLDSKSFENTMLTAWQRVIADDLRGAELALDEFRATYALTPFTTGEVWNAYGYVYTLQENYDRAIDAYEKAIAVFTQAGSTQGRWVELANLYFARNQYDMALDTLLRPRRGSNDATRRMSPEAEALMEKLRALGVTEETL
jgi:TonB family protein